ncbi:MAG: PIN domain-containing protein [Gaiellaceae bacterium]
MIVLDTNVLLYATGADHAFKPASHGLVASIRDGRVRATTIVEVIQEFVHVRSKRRPRREAVELAADYVELLSPLLVVGDAELRVALRLFDRHPRLKAFDALLAAAAIASDADALVSADGAFAGIRGLRHVVPGTPAFERLLA